MRLTVHIDDDLHRAIKKLAGEENISMSQVVNQAIRRGLNTMEANPAKPFRQKIHRMGKPLIDLTKANAFAAELEDEEILRKLSLGK